MANIVDIPATASFEKLWSPAYRVKAPTLINPHLIPADLYEAYSRLWDTEQRLETVVASVIADATVQGPGLVYDRGLNLLRQTIHETSSSEVDGYTWGVIESAGSNSAPYHRGVTLLCEKAGIGNYGHWLIEMLPIVFVMLPHIHRWGWQVRLPIAGAAMNAVMRDSVRLIGVPDEQIKPRSSGPDKYERLVVVTGLTKHGRSYSPRTLDAMDALAANVTTGPQAKIWVTRVSGRRKFVQEGEVVLALRNRGWTIVDPNFMTLEEQIRTFKGAQQIAGVAGAGLTNLVFAPRGTAITVFVPSKMPDVFYWTLSGLKQLDYKEVRCAEDEDEATSGNWDTPIKLGLSDILGNL